MDSREICFRGLIRRHQEPNNRIERDFGLAAPLRFAANPKRFIQGVLPLENDKSWFENWCIDDPMEIVFGSNTSKSLERQNLAVEQGRNWDMEESASLVFHKAGSDCSLGLNTKFKVIQDVNKTIKIMCLGRTCKFTGREERWHWCGKVVAALRPSARR